MEAFEVADTVINMFCSPAPSPAIASQCEARQGIRAHTSHICHPLIPSSLTLTDLNNKLRKQN